MSEPAAVSNEYIKMVNKEGSYIQENNMTKAQEDKKLKVNSITSKKST